MCTNVAITHQIIIPDLIYPDPRIVRNYPVAWQGNLILKNKHAAVQMHHISGNIALAHESLPYAETFHTDSSLKILQRIRFKSNEYKEFHKKLQIDDDHCVMLALPCGTTYPELFKQCDKLKNGFLHYFFQKGAGGIIHAAPPGSMLPTHMIHVFPICELTCANMAKTAPELLKVHAETVNVVVIIVKM
ncbi:hypothetical protein CDAR_381451 [Caerostris darwini]|uniref:SPOC domain-containing protein n=1 Tax=Caerostris darwini TaxID=1538125 RepID=A0AAV4UMK5_9ARAC|nr:hypothetical protein CDAR_381451 [Caerostris darwini]